MILFSYFLLIISVVLLIFLGIKNKKFIPYFVIPILIYFIIEPFFYEMYIEGHDSKLFLSILSGMYQNAIGKNYLHLMQLPYRINYFVIYGFQQPIFYHLPICYIYVILKLFNISDVNSLNIMIIIIHILTALFMYIAQYKIFKNKFVAISGTIFYIGSRYRLYDQYVRFALGEMISFMLIPLLILSLYYIFFENKGEILFVITASLLYQTHMISTYLYFVLILMFLIIFLIMTKKIYIIKKFLKLGIITILINAWLLFPQIYEFLFVDFVNPAFFEGNSHFKYPNVIKDFIFEDTTIFLVSCIILLFFIFFIFLRIFNKNKFINFKRKLNQYSNFNKVFIFMVIAMIFLLLTFDFVPLDKINIPVIKKMIDVLQFRFRLNLVIVPLLSFSFPYFLFIIFDFIYNYINNNTIQYNTIQYNTIQYIYLIIVILITMIPTYKFMNNYWINHNLKKFIFSGWNLDYTLNGTKTSYQFDYNHNVIVSEDDIKIKTDIINSTYILDYEVDDFKNKNIQLPFFDYPIYKVLDENNNKILTKRSENNLIQIDLTKNKGRIVLSQYEPPFFLLGDIISIFTVIYIIIFYILNHLRRKDL